MNKKWIAAAIILPGLLSAQDFTSLRQNAMITFGARLADGTCDTHMRGTCDVKSSLKGFGNSFAVSTSPNSFFVEIDREYITPADEVNIAGKTFREIKEGEEITFVVTNNIKLEDDMVKKMGIDPGHNTILSGKYPLQIDTEKVIIYFTLSKN